jgi:hypothetical protein
MTGVARAPSTLERVRKICAALPEVEIDGDEHHKLSVRGKTIGWHTVDHHGDGRVAAGGPEEARAASGRDPMSSRSVTRHNGHDRTR